MNDRRPPRRDQRTERPERTSRVPDVDRNEHYLILHKIHDDGRITCACREIDKLRVH